MNKRNTKADKKTGSFLLMRPYNCCQMNGISLYKLNDNSLNVKLSCYFCGYNN